jgi:hypothetical protein
MATLFEREEEECETGSGSSVVVNSGHSQSENVDNWENVSACSSKGVPLSKDEIRSIFGGLNPLDIFGNDEDESDGGHDFLYKGRSIRRVRRIKVAKHCGC